MNKQGYEEDVTIDGIDYEVFWNPDTDTEFVVLPNGRIEYL